MQDLDGGVVHGFNYTGSSNVNCMMACTYGLRMCMQDISCTMLVISTENTYMPAMPIFIVLSTASKHNFTVAASYHHNRIIMVSKTVVFSKIII